MAESLTARQRKALRSLAIEGGFDDDEIADALRIYADELARQGLIAASNRPVADQLDRLAEVPADIWRGSAFSPHGRI